MAVVSTLAVDLTLRSASFGRGIRAAQNQLSGFVRFTQTVNRSLGKLGALLGIGAAGGAVAGFTRLITAGIRWGDTLDDVSTRTGIAIKDLTTLELVAVRAGVGFETLAASIQRMQVSISRAGSGGGSSLTALFRSLRLDIEGLKRMNAAAAFSKIADALSKIRNEADRMRAIRMIFGKDSGIIAGIIAGGAGNIQKAAKDVELFNLALDKFDAARLGVLADALFTLAKAWAKLGAELAIRSNLDVHVTMMAAAVSSLAKSLEELRKMSPSGPVPLGMPAVELARKAGKYKIPSDTAPITLSSKPDEIGKWKFLSEKQIQTFKEFDERIKQRGFSAGPSPMSGSPFGLPGVRGDFQRFTPPAPFGAANKFLVDNMFMPIPYGKGTIRLSTMLQIMERGRRMRELEDKAGEANKVIDSIIPDFGDAVEETTKAIRHAVVGTFGARLAQEIGAPTSGSALPTLPALSRSGRVEESQLEVQRGMLQCLKDIRRQSQDDEILN